MEAERFFKQFQKSFNDSITLSLQPYNINKLAVQSRDRMIKRIRHGFSVKTEGGTETFFPKLKQSTIERRDRLHREGKLSKNTMTSLSNVTRSGELINETSLAPFVSGEGKGGIHLTGSRRDGKRNGYVAEQLRKLGFIFMNLSSKEVEGLVLDYAKILKIELTRFLNKPF